MSSLWHQLESPRTRNPSQSWLTLAKDNMALTNEDWKALTQGAKKTVVARDDYIIKEGESYQRMYQVVRGRVRVERAGVPLGHMSWYMCRAVGAKEEPSLPPARKRLAICPF